MKIETLRMLVIGLGIACAVALAAVIYGIVGLAMRPAPPALSEGAPATVLLHQPAGTRIVSVATAEAGRLAVALSGGGAPDRIVLVDAASGAIVQTIELGAPP
ncbi:MAG: hypothetical protein SFV21_18650 [Rhodospirillaceae bacterium]|nr:hypothetical protein [Rhodospirillaceae bacterium]